MNRPNIDLSRLPVGSIMHPFTLGTADGREFSTWDLKGHQNLVIFIFGKTCDEDCRNQLARIRAKYKEFKAAGAEVVVIFRMIREIADEIRFELDLPFPVLVDVDGMVTAHLTYRSPTVIVTDRFGEVVEEHFEEEALKVRLEKLIARVELSELACPE